MTQWQKNDNDVMTRGFSRLSFILCGLLMKIPMTGSWTEAVIATSRYRRICSIVLWYLLVRYTNIAYEYRHVTSVFYLLNEESKFQKSATGGGEILLLSHLPQWPVFEKWLPRREISKVSARDHIRMRRSEILDWFDDDFRSWTNEYFPILQESTTVSSLALTMKMPYVRYDHERVARDSA